MHIEKVTLDDIKKLDDVFVMPDHFPYEMPQGVVLNAQICEDIMNYGCFFWKHVLYVIGGENKKKKKNAEDVKEQEISWFKAASNFSITILQHMEDEKMPMRLIKIHSIHKRSRTFEVPSDVFTNIFSFKKTIEGRGNFQFFGSPTDYERLKGYLMDKMADGRMIDVLGWQNEGFWAFNNIAVDTKVHEYSTYGGFDYGDTNFYLRSANKIYANNHSIYSTQKRFIWVDSGIRFKEWCDQMVKVHGEPAMMMICFAIACSFSDHVFKIHKFFPMMFLYGAAGSGKSKLIEQIQTLFGDPQSPITINSKANTDKAKIRKFAQFNNSIVFMEEFSNDVGSEMIEMLKAIWGRMGYERGNIESAYGTDSVPISSGVAMTGNDYPANDALLSRLIVVEMNKNSFNEEDRKNFGILKKMQIKGYSSIIGEFIRHRDYFENKFADVYDDVKSELAFKMGGLNLIDRNLDNLSVLVTVYELMKKKLDFSFTREQLNDALYKAITKQNLKRDIGGEVSKFWDVFSQLMDDHILKVVPNDDYKIEGDRIYLRFSKVHSKYLRKHYDVFKKTGLTKTSMRDKLAEHNAFEDDLKHKRIGASTSTAMCFDMNKIDEDSRNSIFLDWYKQMADDGDKTIFKRLLVQKGLMQEREMNF